MPNPQQKLALCIGINYVGSGNDLAGCLQDARDWSAALSARGFTVNTLLEEQATRVNVLAEMTTLVKSLNKGDVGVITYSGHGTYVADLNGDEPDARDEAICPVDVFQGQLIVDDELAVLFSDRERGSRLIFVSDSCHSGTVSRFAIAPPRVGQNAPRARFLPPGDWMPKKLRPAPRALGTPRGTPLKSTALLLSGCTDPQVSFDAWIDDKARGAASWAYLTALQELPEKATYRDWMAEVRKRLPSAQYPQDPRIFGTSSQKRWRVFQ